MFSFSGGEKWGLSFAETHSGDGVMWIRRANLPKKELVFFLISIVISFLAFVRPTVTKTQNIFKFWNVFIRLQVAVFILNNLKKKKLTRYRYCNFYIFTFLNMLKTWKLSFSQILNAKLNISFVFSGGHSNDFSILYQKAWGFSLNFQGIWAEGFQELGIFFLCHFFQFILFAYRKRKLRSLKIRPCSLHGTIFVAQFHHNLNVRIPSSLQ